MLPGRADAERRVEGPAALGGLERAARVRGPVARGRRPQRAGVEAARASRRPVRSSRRRRRRSRRRSAATELGLPLLLAPRRGLHDARAAPLGCVEEARAFFWWQMHATRTTEPYLQPLYCIDGGSAPMRRSSRCPATGARSPSGSATRRRRSSSSTHTATCSRCLALLVAGPARSAARGKRDRRASRTSSSPVERPDPGSGKSRDEPRHYVQSKAMCWAALESAAAKLADAGVVPTEARWRRRRPTTDQRLGRAGGLGRERA